MNPRELAEKWVTNKDKEAFLEDVHSLLNEYHYIVTVLKPRVPPEVDAWFRKAPKPEDTNASNQ